jgi:hypothetical protein
MFVAGTLTKGELLTGLQQDEPKPERLVATTFFIEPSQLRALKDWSDQTMAPMGALIRRAIRESLVTHEKGEAK